VETFHIIVPILFWTLLYSPQSDPVYTWITVSKHGVDAFIVICEALLNRATLRLRDLLVVLTVGLLFVFWMWIVHAIFGTWPYAFLAFNKGPVVIAYYVMVIAACIIAFGLMWTLHYLKERCFNKQSEHATDEQAATARRV